MNDYPFLIRGPTKAGRVRIIKVHALTLKLALDKILALFPIKFVNTKFARRMDLISAKVEAAKKSRVEGKPIYIIVDPKDGECSLSSKPDKGVYTVFKNGGEIALEPDSEISRVEPKQHKKGGKLSPKDTAKENAPTPIKGAKTNKLPVMADKKAAKVVATKKAPKAKKAEVTGKATTLILSDAQWAKVEKLIEKEGSIREMVAKAMIKTYGL